MYKAKERSAKEAEKVSKMRMNVVKRLLTVGLVGVMALSMCACGNEKESNTDKAPISVERELDKKENVEADNVKAEEPAIENEISLDTLEFTPFVVNRTLKKDGKEIESAFNGMEFMLITPNSATYNPEFSGAGYNYYSGTKVKGVCVTVKVDFFAKKDKDVADALKLYPERVLYNENGNTVIYRDTSTIQEITVYTPASDTESIVIDYDFVYGDDSDYSTLFKAQYWELLKESVVSNFNGELENMMKNWKVSSINIEVSSKDQENNEVTEPEASTDNATVDAPNIVFTEMIGEYTADNGTKLWIASPFGEYDNLRGPVSVEIIKEHDIAWTDSGAEIDGNKATCYDGNGQKVYVTRTGEDTISVELFNGDKLDYKLTNPGYDYNDF